MKYGVMGYSGRMGKLIEEVFTERGHQLVYRCDLDDEVQEDIPDLLVDFSTSEAFDKLIEKAEQFKCSLVVGTTALEQPDIRQLKEYAKMNPVVYARNFSRGILMLKNIVNGLSDDMHDWDIAITERHHRFKKDAPSGTAKMLAECFDFDVPVTSMRAGGIPGEHAIIIAGLGEVIEIKHQAISARTFAEGACFSAERLVHLTRGFYTFDEICAMEVENG